MQYGNKHRFLCVSLVDEGEKTVKAISAPHLHNYACPSLSDSQNIMNTGDVNIPNTGNLSKIGLMLGQRLRRWPNIKTTLDQFLEMNIAQTLCIAVLPDTIRYVEPMLAYCWVNIADGGPTLTHHRLDTSRLRRLFWYNVISSACIL